MISFKKHYLYTILILALGAIFNACNEIEDIETAQGTLHFSISQISVKTETRATPSELGKPLASKFNLKLQRTGTSLVAYDGKFVETMQVKTGMYNITATCGDNPIIGRNSPYYTGKSDNVAVNTGTTTAVTIPCKVANALISVKFGKDEEERIRFGRFYDDFGVLVFVDDYSMEIPMNDSQSSIYFRAGSSPKLVFYGKLKNDHNRPISFDLTSESLPKVFQEADHAIVTLTLPDPESASIVNIGKVAVEDANMDETIPLSWLPVPTATPKHQYDGNGYLVGTNVTFSNSYPGMNWKAVLVNANGEEVREIEGQGELLTKYDNSTEWPYLPQGKYTAHYYFLTNEGETKVSSREFTVPQPQIEVSAGGYSSYTKYLEGDIDGANTCNNKTIYEPTVRMHVSENLLLNSRYNYTFNYVFEGTTTPVDRGRNSFRNVNIEKLEPRSKSYEVVANASFDGAVAEARHRVYITGIPFHFEPPTTAEWETVNEVTDEDGYALLGNFAWTTDQRMIYKVYVPVGTLLTLDYSFETCVVWASTNTTTISSQNVVWVQETVKAGAFETEKKVSKAGSLDISTDTDVISSVICTNAYAAEESYTKLFKIGMKYRK
jgi:hypothetical protein